MMHYLSSTLFGLGALFGVATAAFAAAGDIKAKISELQLNVTYSTTSPAVLTTYVGYTVAIKNEGTNTINDIRFTASASVIDPAELATFDSAEGGATCKTTNEAKTAIECVIGQLKSGASYPTFAVFFKAPAKILNGTADVEGDAVNLSGATIYAEGSNGANPAPNSLVPWTSPPPVILGTFSDTDVKSSVPKAGGTFFTGIAGVSRGTDRFTTAVTVPEVASFSTAEIVESTYTQGCTNFSVCWQSDITIKGNVTNTYSPYLTIVLRQDALNIKPGTKIGSVQIWYDGSGELNDSFHGYLGPCTDAITPLSDRPCIAEVKHYKSRSVKGWTADLDGDFEWTVISRKNGRLAID